MSKTMRSDSGFSLVELMVAMAVALLLLTATTSLFINSKRSYLQSNRFARVEENARYALFEVENDIRLAKFFGEAQASDITKDANLGTVTSDCTGDAAAYEFNQPLVAVNASAGSAFGCVTNAVVGSDVIAVKSVRPMPYEDTDDDGDIDANDGLTIDANMSYVMANSTTAVLFDGADTAPTISSGGSVPDGKAWEYQAKVYYVNSNTTSLNRKVLRMNSGSMSMVDEEVVEGVENMRLLFGVSDNAGQVDQFVNATSVTDWDRVAAVRIFLLIQSETDPFFKDEKTYNLGHGSSLTFNDDHHRVLVSTTLSVRNPQLTIRGGL